MDLISKVLAVDSNAGKNLIKDTTLTGGLGDIVGKLVPWIGGIAAIIAFVFLIYSGFLYLTAGGNPDAAKKGQAGILNAIIGLVIIALAWWLVTAVTSSLGSGIKAN